eukprot:3183187-Pleurochrysis_carterae.AAC.4
MANAMTEAGARKATEGQAGYSNWSLNVDGEEQKGGYGPCHRLSEHLKVGGNGNGIHARTFFEQMHACFTLPLHERKGGVAAESDPFQPVRRFLDALRDTFHSAVVCSWLICLDKSMVQWEGRIMPGLMVVARKLTPVGLELHTLCCGLCSILMAKSSERLLKQPGNGNTKRNLATDAQGSRQWCDSKHS